MAYGDSTITLTIAAKDLASTEIQKISTNLAAFEGKAKSAGARMQAVGSQMSSAGMSLTKNLTLPIVAVGGAAIKLAIDAEETEARLTSAFESMGASSWTSLETLRGKAEELMSRTTFDDEAIKDAQAVMLTFGNVTGESFDKGIESALDLSSALGTDLQSATIMIGKALNDPVKGITAMTRAGIQFTEEQKGMIRSMVESGDTMGAQTIILGELEKQFGGTAEAMAGTAKGQMMQAMNELAEAGEEIGAMLLPVVRDMAGHIRNLATWFKNLSPETKGFIIQIAGMVAVVGPALIIVGKLTSAFGSMLSVIGGAAGLVARIIGLTAATQADTVATTANTTARNLNKTALLGVGAAGLTAVAGVVAVDQAFNNANEKGAEFLDLWRQMPQPQRDATASTEVFGQKLGTVMGHFANFTGIIAPWHSVAGTTRDIANEMNGLAGATERSEARWLSYVPVPKRAADSLGLMVDATGRVSGGFAAMQQNTLTSAGNIKSGVIPILSSISQKFREMRDDGVEATKDMARDIASTLRGNKDTVGNAMKDLTFVMTNPMKLTKEVARIESALTGDKLAQGLRSKDPVVRAQAVHTKNILTAQWEALTGQTYSDFVQVANAAERGLSTFNPARWHIPRPTFSGLGMGGGRQHGGPVTAGRTYIVGEQRPELFTPNQNGYITPRVPSSAGLGNFNFNLTLQSLVPPTGAQGQAVAQAIVPELVREMRRQHLLPAF